MPYLYNLQDDCIKTHLLESCCRKTYQPLIWLLLWSFCLVITHVSTLSVCMQRAIAAGENSRVAGGDGTEQPRQPTNPERDKDWSYWLPYRTSVKLSFVSTAFLHAVLLFSLLNQKKLITFIFQNPLMFASWSKMLLLPTPYLL